MHQIKEVRCKNCQRLLAKVKGDAEIKCPRCKTINIVKQ